MTAMESFCGPDERRDDFKMGRNLVPQINTNVKCQRFSLKMDDSSNQASGDRLQSFETDFSLNARQGFL
jgi:hypothetical protein